MNELADRRSEEKERRRGEILDAAVAVAEEQGLEALTMDQVARKARLSRALLYVYFADKFDLLIGVCERALQLLQQQFIAAVAGPLTGRAQVLACGRAYVAFAQEHPVYFATLSMLQAHSAEIAAANRNEMACLECGDRVHAVIIASLERGAVDGSVRADLGPAKLVAMTLWGFMHGIVQIATTKGELLARDGYPVEQLIEQALQLCAHALEKPAANAAVPPAGQRS